MTVTQLFVISYFAGLALCPYGACAYATLPFWIQSAIRSYAAFTISNAAGFCWILHTWCLFFALSLSADLSILPSPFLSSVYSSINPSLSLLSVPVSLYIRTSLSLSFCVLYTYTFFLSLSIPRSLAAAMNSFVLNWREKSESRMDCVVETAANYLIAWRNDTVKKKHGVTAGSRLYAQ